MDSKLKKAIIFLVIVAMLAIAWYALRIAGVRVERIIFEQSYQKQIADQKQLAKWKSNLESVEAQMEARQCSDPDNQGTEVCIELKGDQILFKSNIKQLEGE